MSPLPESKKAERPILFSGPMVRAILREIDPKTQTRRVGKIQNHEYTQLGVSYIGHATKGTVALATYRAFPDQGSARWAICECPYGVPGDRLWIRETFALQSNVEDDLPPFADGRPVKHFDGEDESGWLQPHYRATDPMPEPGCPEDERHNCGSEDICASPWKPSIFMPRWASRITLEVTEVRVQRVQEISKADCIAEGMEGLDDVHAGWHQNYAQLWDSINLKRGFGWDANPWVWCVTFKKGE